MGEISEALRRAREERSDTAPERGSEPAPREAAEDVYSTSARLHEEETRAAEPSPAPDPATPRGPSPPAPAPSAATGPRARVEAEVPAVALTHNAHESQTAQAVLVDEGGTVTDACLQLALRVRKALLDRNAGTLAVVSALRNEGKTTVSCNLALAMASLGPVHRVALVDLDLRRPSLRSVLELSTPRHGIGDVLARGEPLASACVRVANPRLDVYPCLGGNAKAHELLLSTRFREVVAELRDLYEVVIFDTPPCLLVPDATIILQEVDAFAPVARAGMTRARNFHKVLEALPRSRMLGAVLDYGSPATSKGYYDHYSAAEGELEPAEHPHAG